MQLQSRTTSLLTVALSLLPQHSSLTCLVSSMQTCMVVQRQSALASSQVSTDSRDLSAQATFQKVQTAQSSVIPQSVLHPVISILVQKVHIQRLGLLQTKMDSPSAIVDSWTSAQEQTSSQLTACLEQRFSSLPRLSAWSNLEVGRFQKLGHSSERPFFVVSNT